MLGRQPVVDGDDDGVAQLRQQLLAGAVVGIDVAHDPTAAVVVDDDRQVVALSGVDTDGDLAGGAGNGAVFDAGGFGRAGLEGGEAGDGGAGFVGGLFVEFGSAGGGELVEEALNLRIDGHGESFRVASRVGARIVGQRAG